MFPAVGCVTARAKAVATAASTALPPSRSTSAPTREATSLCDTTMPVFERVGTDAADASPATRSADVQADRTTSFRPTDISEPPARGL